MSYIKASLLATVITLLTSVSAHGTVSGIVSGGKYFPGYNPSFQFYNPEPKVAGWRVPEGLDNGFVAPSQYGNPNIICHKGAMNPLGEPIPVTAGSEVQLQWTPWPESHHGPVIDYLAACNGGDCSTVDKTTLQFFKIGEAGLKIGSGVPGTWASDDLIKNNNTWVAKIPADIAPGNYVLRHEIIALHSSGQVDGAQNYPQCINIAVSGSGSAKPAGVVGTKLYTDQDPGILVNIYQNLAAYVIPGPKLYSGGGAAQPAPVVSSSATAVKPTSAAPAGSTSAAAPVATPSPDQNEIPGSGPIEEDETTTLQVTLTSSVVSAPVASPAPEACIPSTITEKGPTITAAGPTVTVGGGNTATVTVTAAAQTVTVTAQPTFKAMPSGATVDDLMRWLGSKIGGGNKRRHAREVQV